MNKESIKDDTYELTQDQQNALEVVSTGKNTFISGGAGVGKSTLIKDIQMRFLLQGKKILLMAPTGIAAYNIGGKTIHSALRCAYSFELDEVDIIQMVERLKAFHVWIIDEISMVKTQLFKLMYRYIQQCGYKIQLIVIGDFYQLPPVKSEYVFLSKEWWQFKFQYCALNQVVRQSGAELIENLNKARVGDKSCLQYFIDNASKEELPNFPYLCAYKKDMNRINRKKISELSGPMKIYRAKCSERIIESEFSGALKLPIKKGMRVISIINDSEQRYYNGAQGVVLEMDENNVWVKFDNGYTVKFGYHAFDVRSANGDYDVTVHQIPLLPAYALTIHRSQGMTLEGANIVAPKCFAKGQFYVAISRVKDVKNIYFGEGISASCLDYSKKVKAFYEKIAEKKVC